MQPSGRRIGIIQSNYIPWKGYFDFIASVDEFVLLDDVQYTKNDWRNRNLIKTHSGLQWLTIPVLMTGKYGQTIEEARISTPAWVDKHLASIRHAYAKAPFFRTEWEWLVETYDAVRSSTSLSDVNAHLLRRTCNHIGIETPIRFSREIPASGDKNERLIAICTALGASRYLSGPAAKDYIDPRLWNVSGIEVQYKSYAAYPEYPQLHADFAHGVSIIDVLFNTGPEAAAFIRSSPEIQDPS